MEGRKTSIVDGGCGGGKYIKKVKNFCDLIWCCPFKEEHHVNILRPCGTNQSGHQCKSRNAETSDLYYFHNLFSNIMLTIQSFTLLIRESDMQQHSRQTGTTGLISKNTTHLTQIIIVKSNIN